MSFMKRLNEGEAGKIILTQLMKMATSLGMDTVCEGVETDEQVRFLQEIGCSKLQGYFFCKPIPVETIFERYRKGIQIGFENPKESGYYEEMGRINLVDLSFLAGKDESIFRNTFDTLPMGVLELTPDGEKVRFARSNESMRDFIYKMFGLDLTDQSSEVEVPRSGPGSIFLRKIAECRSKGERVFIEETAGDGTVVNSFARRIGVNPQNGNTSVVTAVLSIVEPNEGATYASIARALAADYYNLFYVTLSSEAFIEYSSPVGREGITLEQRGKNFFKQAREDALHRIYEKDQEIFLGRFTKENILRELDEKGFYIIVYRLIEDGEPSYVRMKITRMEGDADHIIIGVSIIDAERKMQEEENRRRQERAALERIAALAPDYLVLYTVETRTGHYIQYSPSNEFSKFGLARQGDDFFKDVRLDAPKAIAPEDLEHHLSVLTQENMMRAIKEDGFFFHHYHLMVGGKPIAVCLKATMIPEDGEDKIILGVMSAEKESEKDA